MIKSKDILQKSQSNILSAASLIAFATAISSILGLVRVRLINTYYTSDISGLFFIADQIPSFLLNIVVVGAMSSSFLPVFTYFVEKGENKKAWQMTSTLITISFLVLFIIYSFVFLFPKSLISILPLSKTVSEFDFITLESLVRIMIIPQLIFLFSSFMTTILHSYKKFIIPSVSILLYNVGVICVMILFHESFGIFAPALGMILGTMLALLFQFPFVKKLGFEFRPSFKIYDESVRQVFKLFGPRTLGLILYHLNTFLEISVFAAYIAVSAVTPFANANQLQTFPVTFLGLAMAQAAFPTLSSLFAKNDTKTFKSTLITSFLQLSFLILPVAVVMIGLRIQLVRLIFGGDKFSWLDTLTAAYTLSFFALSIPFQALNELLSRAYYSMQDTWTPVRFRTLGILMNISLSYLFVFVLKYGVWSLALSYSVSSIVSFILSVSFMEKKFGGEFVSLLVRPLIKILYSSALLGGILYIAMKVLGEYVLDTTKTLNLVVLVGVVSVFSFGWYLIITYFMKVKEIQMFWNFITRAKKYLPLFHNVK